MTAWFACEEFYNRQPSNCASSSFRTQYLVAIWSIESSAVLPSTFGSFTHFAFGTPHWKYGAQGNTRRGICLKLRFASPWTCISAEKGLSLERSARPYLEMDPHMPTKKGQQITTFSR